MKMSFPYTRVFQTDARVSCACRQNFHTLETIRFPKEAPKILQSDSLEASPGRPSRIILIRLAWQHRPRRSFLRPFAACFAPGVGESLLAGYECPSHSLSLSSLAHLSKCEEILLQLLPLGRGLLALPPDELEHLDSPLDQLSVAGSSLSLSPPSFSLALFFFSREHHARVSLVARHTQVPTRTLTGGRA